MSLWLQILVWGMATLVLAALVLLASGFYHWIRHHWADGSTTNVES